MGATWNTRRVSSRTGPRLRTIEAAAGFYRREVTVHSCGRSTVVPAALATDWFFDVLGTPAAFGHLPSPGDSLDAMVGRRWMD